LLYLLDTCSYLRLAYSIHPLLGQQYVPPPEVAQVTSEVHTEWVKQPKLQNKFHWLDEAQFVQNRAANLASVLTLKGKQPTQILRMRQNIRCHAESSGAAIKASGHTIPSPTDCAVLAYVFVLANDGVATIAVSDDGGMGWVANNLQIPLITSLDLVHRMFIAKTQTASQIKTVAAYLDYQDDLPHNWRTKGQHLFGISIP